MKTVLKYAIVVTMVMLLSGCECLICPKKPAAQKPAPQPAAKAVVPAAKPAVKDTTCGPYIASNMYQTCDAVKLTKTMPQEVMANKNFDYYIEVANLTDMVLTNVMVTDNLGKGVKFDSASPAAKVDGNKLVWTMDTLAPKAVEKIKVTVAAVETGCVKTCAKVRYEILTCANTNVVSPALKITKEAPAEVLLCDAIPVKITVSNTGTGVTKNVVIKDMLPEGLTADGKKDVTITVGDLEPKQSKTVTVMAKAQKTGTYMNKAVAQADGDIKAESTETKTVVRQPVLAISKTAPANTIIGREVMYEITVTNKGDAAADKTTIKDMVPSNATFVKASDGGALSAGSVVWNIGTLAPNASKKVTVAYKATGGGEISNKATVMAVCAQEVAATAKTTAKGVPGVLLEMVDLEDPIVVGNNVTYVITVTNQGFAPLTNLIVKGFVQEGMKYENSSGETVGAFAGDTLTFGPVANLAPKAKVQWKVIIKATAAGNHVFKVTLKTNELPTELQKFETTNFYE